MTAFDMDVRNDAIGPMVRFINWCFVRGRPRWLRRLVSILFHVELPILQSQVKMPHPYGIVVNPQVTLGNGVVLFQGVTVGSKRYGQNAGVPNIGNRVVVYPNAVIVGNVSIGDGATIAPGAVVITDVPPGATAVGNPARIL